MPPQQLAEAQEFGRVEQVEEEEEQREEGVLQARRTYLDVV